MENYPQIYYKIKKELEGLNAKKVELIETVYQAKNEYNNVKI